MGKKIEMIGKRFGRLVVLEEDGRTTYNNIQYKCICDCGNYSTIDGDSLRKGHTKSCGCLSKEKGWHIGCFEQKVNKYEELDDKTMICYVHNTDEKLYFDKEDYDKVKKYCWYNAHPRKLRGGYIRATINCKKVMFHKFIMNFSSGIIDHIDRNILNNRKENLRIVNDSQSIMNTNLRKDSITGIRGVNKIMINDCEKWKSRLNFNKKALLNKVYDTFEEAIISRLQSEKEHLGEFAPQKHLFEKYGII